MQKIVFDSKSTNFKKPFGAVSTNENTEFNIYIKKDEAFSEMFFVYRNDGSENSTYILMHKTGENDSYYIFSCVVKFDKPDLYFYRFELKCNGISKFIGNKNGQAVIEDWLPEWQLTVYDAGFKTPDWVKGGIMYQIFPDRFCKSEDFSPFPSKNERKIHESWNDIPEFIYDNPNYNANDFFCGNLKGVLEKLDYIKSFGVNIIYFNPIFESPENHRYSTGNYFNLDPYFGTNEQFKEFIKLCDQKGIKVILDGVFSHTGADSIYFNKYNHYDSVGAYNSADSPYFNWYNFTEYPDKYECWWGFENLPNVNETNKGYMNYITGKDGVIKFWQNMGCSGWRLDVADELPDEFIDSLYASSKDDNTQSFIIGEVWEDATNKFSYGVRRRYLLGGQMDSVMNYPWRTAVLDFVTDGNQQIFNERIMSILENYPPQVIQCLMNSISTHDTVRAITQLGVMHDIPEEEKGKYTLTDEEYSIGKNRLKLAVFLQFTLPGIPCIYYGDEAGLSGFRDPYCRKTYPYGYEDFELIEFFQKIAKIRTEHKSDFLSSFLLYEMSDGMYSFLRGNLLCVINVNEIPKLISTDKKCIVWSYGEFKEEGNGFLIQPYTCVILK